MTRSSQSRSCEPAPNVLIDVVHGIVDELLFQPSIALVVVVEDSRLGGDVRQNLSLQRFPAHVRYYLRCPRSALEGKKQ